MSPQRRVRLQGSGQQAGSMTLTGTVVSDVPCGSVASRTIVTPAVPEQEAERLRPVDDGDHEALGVGFTIAANTVGGVAARTARIAGLFPGAAAAEVRAREVALRGRRGTRRPPVGLWTRDPHRGGGRGRGLRGRVAGRAHVSHGLAYMFRPGSTTCTTSPSRRSLPRHRRRSRSPRRPRRERGSGRPTCSRRRPGRRPAPLRRASEKGDHRIGAHPDRGVMD